MAFTTSTSDKFGVPIPGRANGGTLMPKLKNRFRVRLLDFGVTNDETDITRNVQNVTRPTVSYEEMTIDTYNSKVYYQGKHTWETISLVVRDDLSNGVTRMVAQQQQRQIDHFQQVSARSASDYKFNMVIELLDGSDLTEPVETWFLEGCFLTNVDYSEVDYSTSDPVTVTMTIRYDNALLADNNENPQTNSPVALGRDSATTQR